MGQKRKAPVEKQEGFSKRPKQDSRHNVAKATRNQLLFPPRSDWHTFELPPTTTNDVKTLPPQTTIDALHTYAESILEAENVAYKTAQSSGSSQNKFLSEIMSSGTLEDKVSALTLIVQESPLHTTKAFENLLGLSKKKSRNQALMAVAALKDLLGQGVVLPADRKLRAFGKQPLLIGALQGKNMRWSNGEPLPGGLQKVHLLVWAYEDWLKKSYFELLQILETWCSDEVEYARSRAITYVWELLRDKPEQEENLLRLIVNKLGDTDRKIASRASYLLLQLENTHPAMKITITNSIEADCLFRSGQSLHARYYAIITLNQTILSQKEQSVANRLLDLYFSLFVQLLKPIEQQQKPQRDEKLQGGGGKAGKLAARKQKAQERSKDADEQLREKMIAQVLTGVNRAFPFADTSDPTFEKQIDMIFRVTHSANFNTSVQALLLIQQISSTKHYAADRFYRTLYESLLDPRLASSSKQVLYLNLLYKSLKNDLSAKRVQTFVKRLLQIITMHEPPFACGVLYMISELETSFPSIRQMIKQQEVNDDDEEEHFVDAPEDGQTALAEPQPRKESSNGIHYDPRKRDPEHAHAERSCLWDLLPFLQHFHPSVALFAQALLSQKQMPPKPDTTQHTLMHFLDRFVYRNAKTKTSATHGSSIMQPLAGSAAADMLVKPGRDVNGASVPVNSEQFWQKKVEDVAPDEVFFHNYFNQAGNKRRNQSEREKKRAKIEDQSDAGSDAEDEEEIWEALVNSRRDIEGPDEDDDLSMGDLESAYSASDSGSGSGIDLGGEDVNGNLEETMVDAGSENGSGSEDLPELDDDDEDAFLDDNDEIPDGFDAAAESEEESNKEPSKSQKKRKERKKLKSLPIFASAEDYEKMLQDEPDDV